MRIIIVIALFLQGETAFTLTLVNPYWTFWVTWSAELPDTRPGPHTGKGPAFPAVLSPLLWTL